MERKRKLSTPGCKSRTTVFCRKSNHSIEFVQLVKTIEHFSNTIPSASILGLSLCLVLPYVCPVLWLGILELVLYLKLPVVPIVVYTNSLAKSQSFFLRSHSVKNILLFFYRRFFDNGRSFSSLPWTVWQWGTSSASKNWFWLCVKKVLV